MEVIEWVWHVRSVGVGGAWRSLGVGVACEVSMSGWDMGHL